MSVDRTRRVRASAPAPGQAGSAARARPAGPAGAAFGRHDDTEQVSAPDGGLRPVEAHLLRLQRQAGNRATAALVLDVQRAPRSKRRPRGTVQVVSGDAIMAAIALDAMLQGTAGRERLGDLSGKARVSAEILLGAIDGVSPAGRKHITPPERLSLFDSAEPALTSVLNAADRDAGGELDEAKRARRALQSLRTRWVQGAAEAAVADEVGSAELRSPKVKAQRLTLAEAAKAGVKLYLRADKYLAATDIPGLTQDLRKARIATLEGVIALCSVDDWPSYQKAVDAVNKQLARTDPDRMLGAGAAVLDQMKNASLFVTKSVNLVGMGMRGMLLARGMMKEAALVSSSLEGLAKFSKALAVIDVLSSAMVLLDSQASGSKKIGAGLSFAGGTSTIVAAGADAMGMTATAGAAATMGTALGGAAITYESYKALAEYGYTSVVGGLSYAAVDEELEGSVSTRDGTRVRSGGLEPLGRELAMRRARVEALDQRLASAGANDRTGIERALDGEVRRLQGALHALRKRWELSPQPAIRSRLPDTDELTWSNAMAKGPDLGTLLELAQDHENALALAFATKDQIADQTMHDTMKKR